MAPKKPQKSAEIDEKSRVFALRPRAIEQFGGLLGGERNTFPDRHNRTTTWTRPSLDMVSSPSRTLATGE